jgi:hypothetical protein
MEVKAYGERLNSACVFPWIILEWRNVPMVDRCHRYVCTETKSVLATCMQATLTRMSVEVHEHAGAAREIRLGRSLRPEVAQYPFKATRTAT